MPGAPDARINWEMAWSDKNRLMTAGIASVTRRAGPLYLHLDCEGLTVPPELDCRQRRVLL